MRSLRLLVLPVALGPLLGCRQEAPAPPSPLPAPTRKPSSPALRSAALAARSPNSTRVEQARALLRGGGREGRCGPYPLWTDSSDSRLLAACARIGATLDGTFASRFGVRPAGAGAEGIVLFSEVSAYRRYVQQDGRLAAGYAGFASEVDGLVVLHAGVPRAQTLTTLAHELTHMVQRRSLGNALPPWLSEGLADAVGYSAGEEGLGELSGLRGVEVQAERLRAAYRERVVEGLERLASLPRSRFDRDVRSYDYEQSALLVRYLLLDPALKPRFRAYLARLGEGERYDAERCRNALGISWSALDAGLRGWVERESVARKR